MKRKIGGKNSKADVGMAMMAEEIKKAVRRANSKAGKGILEVVFKKVEGLSVVGDFLDMVCYEEVVLSEEHYARLNHIWQRSTWGCPRNMTVRFGIGVEFNVDKFCKRMAKAIVGIKAIE